MRKTLITTVLSIVALLIFLVIVFVAVGGGFGDKPPLPIKLQTASRPVLISHRGVTVAKVNTPTDSIVYQSAPENTLQAFVNAKARNYRWIELDIQYSADGQFIVFHDKYGGAELPYVGAVSELSVGELQAHKLVASGELTDYAIPTLDGVISRFDTTMLYYFDMKKHGHTSIFKLADDIAEFIEQRGIQQRTFVASHRVAFISYLEFAHPKINTVLEGFNQQVADAIEYVPRKFKPDMLAGYQAALNEYLVLNLRESGWIQRYVAFHVDSMNLSQTLGWGIQYIMLDDGEYVDSLLELQD
jgi:glycerophosphoryl diester phosphodiesterase